MDNGYYKVVRLKTGESILCTMTNDVKSHAGEAYISVNMPVQVIQQNETRRPGQVVGESFLLRPWIGLSDSDEFVISTDIILTIGDLKREVKEYYMQYVEQTVETQKRMKDAQDRSEAADQLLRDVSNGKLNLVDDYLSEDHYDESEENY